VVIDSSQLSEEQVLRQIETLVERTLVGSGRQER
jgi:hypothetical protein